VSEPGFFRILDPSSRLDRLAWVEAWSATENLEVQAHPDYGRAVLAQDERLLGAVAVTATGSAILPFVVREIPTRSATCTHDAITPYGYGGAYVDGKVETSWFWSCWDDWAATHGLSGITVRSHLFGDEVLPVEGPRVTPLSNVVVDLERSVDEIWAGYEGRVRTDVRRGRRLGIEVIADETCSRLDDFYSLYRETMHEKHADDFYLFGLDRLASLIDALGSHVALFHARLDGRLVGSEMQLVGGRNAYYFLSGATSEGRRSSANPTMKHEVIRWLKTKGIKRYVLGGGMHRDDSLFRYKRSFSPRSVVDFSVAFHEARSGAVRELVSARMKEEPSWKPVPGFIPDYRAPRLRDDGGS
jgi:hypothetical protein